MSKEQLIEGLFYLGYGVAAMLLSAVILIICYVVFFSLLRVKRVRKIASDVILMNEIRSLSDVKFDYLMMQIQRARRKAKKEFDIPNQEKKLLIELPKHNCGLYITHNRHKDNYQNLEEFLDDRELDIDDELKNRCIKANELWELEWYPDTPVGQYCVYGATLEECLKKALS